MKHFLIPLILFSMFSSGSLFGKGNNELLFEAGAGAGSGWWVYNKGSLDGSVEGNNGWDHTAAKPSINFESSFIYKQNRFKIGANFNYVMLKATIMLRHDDFRYYVSDNFVKLTKAGIMLEYDIFSKTRYALAPHVAVGTFFIDTSHPEKGNFGFKLYVAIGVNNDILLKGRFWLTIRPVFNVMTIWPQQSAAKGEKHHLYSMGINLGTRIKLY